jgi:hypothetical protein
LHKLTDEQPEVKDYAAQRPDLVKNLTEAHAAWEKEIEGR